MDGSKPAQANGLQDPNSKKPNMHTKRAGGVAQDVGPEFKSQYCKERERDRERETKWGGMVRTERSSRGIQETD
jgi:hypothetical protein